MVDGRWKNRVDKATNARSQSPHPRPFSILEKGGMQFNHRGTEAFFKCRLLFSKNAGSTIPFVLTWGLCARWPGETAGRRDGTRGEASFRLDLFWYFFGSSQKSTNEIDELNVKVARPSPVPTRDDNRNSS